MKKFLKIVCIIVVILVILVWANYLRNNSIIKKIISNGNESFNDEVKNFHITDTTTDSDNYNTSIEVYRKDNIYYIETYEDSKITKKEWKDYVTGEKIAFYTDGTEAEFNDEYINTLSSIHMSKDFDVGSLFLKFINTEENCYVIKCDNNITYKYEKNSGLLKEVISGNMGYVEKYSYEFNTVTDAEIQKPEI